MLFLKGPLLISLRNAPIILKSIIDILNVWNTVLIFYRPKLRPRIFGEVHFYVITAATLWSDY